MEVVASDGRANPCVRVCRYNEEGACLGCFRTRDEVRGWASLDAGERRVVLADLDGRRASYWGAAS